MMYVSCKATRKVVCHIGTRVEDEINVPIALRAFRDTGSRLWSLKKRKKKKDII